MTELMLGLRAITVNGVSHPVESAEPQGAGGLGASGHRTKWVGGGAAVQVLTRGSRMPARYVIDKEGIIRAADVNANYTTRPEPSETVGLPRTLYSLTRRRVKRNRDVYPSGPWHGTPHACQCSL